MQHNAPNNICNTIMDLLVARHMLAKQATLYFNQQQATAIEPERNSIRWIQVGSNNIGIWNINHSLLLHMKHHQLANKHRCWPLCYHHLQLEANVAASEPCLTVVVPCGCALLASLIMFMTIPFYSCLTLECLLCNTHLPASSPPMLSSSL